LNIKFGTILFVISLGIGFTVGQIGSQVEVVRGNIETQVQNVASNPELTDAMEKIVKDIRSKGHTSNLKEKNNVGARAIIDPLNTIDKELETGQSIAIDGLNKAIRRDPAAIDRLYHNYENFKYKNVRKSLKILYFMATVENNREMAIYEAWDQLEFYLREKKYPEVLNFYKFIVAKSRDEDEVMDLTNSLLELEGDASDTIRKTTLVYLKIYHPHLHKNYLTR